MKQCTVEDIQDLVPQFDPKNIKENLKDFTFMRGTSLDHLQNRKLKVIALNRNDYFFLVKKGAEK